MHAFSKDMEILPFLAVLFKSTTAMSILGSRAPAAKTTEPHSFQQIPLPTRQDNYWVHHPLFSKCIIIVRKCKTSIFPSNKLEILLRCPASAFCNALSCVKGFCICRREKSTLLEQLLSVSVCIKNQVKRKVKVKLNIFTSYSIRKAVSSTQCIPV